MTAENSCLVELSEAQEPVSEKYRPTLQQYFEFSFSKALAQQRWDRLAAADLEDEPGFASVIQ